MERIFDVLNLTGLLFDTLEHPTRTWEVDTMWEVMIVCVIMHNITAGNDRDDVIYDLAGWDFFTLCLGPSMPLWNSKITRGARASTGWSLPLIDLLALVPLSSQLASQHPNKDMKPYAPLPPIDMLNYMNQTPLCGLAPATAAKGRDSTLVRLYSWLAQHLFLSLPGLS